MRRIGGARRWLRGLGLGLGLGMAGLAGLVGLALGLAAWVVFTPTGTGLALRWVVEQYSSSIPGHITFSGSEGALSDVCLHDLRLRDAKGRALLQVGRACLRLRLSSLRERHVEVEQVTLVDPRVHLWPDSSWSDLAPPGPEPPSTEPPGPDLPVLVTGAVDAWGLAVLSHGDDDSTEALVRNVGARVELRAEGRRAHARLSPLWGEVPPASAVMLGGSMELDWQSPVITVESLSLTSSLGLVQRLRGHLDTQSMTYAVEAEAVVLAPPGANPRVPVTVTLAARGSARGSDGETMATAKASAPGARAVASWDGTHARAHVELTGARADVRALVRDGSLHTIEGTAVVSSAARATAVLGPLLPIEVPQLAGKGRVGATCRQREALHCWMHAAVQHGSDRIETRVELDLGTPVVLDVEHLRGQLRGQPLMLVAPARVTLGEGSASATPVRLAAAGGTIEAAGRVVWSGRQASAFDIRLRRVDSSVIGQLVPQVPIRGRLDATLSFVGNPRHPVIDASVVLHGLGWARHELGDVKLDARYRDQRAHAELRWRVGPSRARVLANLPVALDLEARHARWRPTAAMTVGVDVDRLDLPQLAQWIDGPPLRGRARAIVRAVGSPSAPSVELEVLGTGLGVGSQALGTARLRAISRDGKTQAFASLRSPVLGRVQVDATAPLAITPLRGGIRYQRGGHHHLEARLERLDLGELMSVVQRVTGDDGTARPPVEGVIRGRAEASARGDALSAEVWLAVQEPRVPVQGVAASRAELSATVDGTRHAPTLVATLTTQGMRVQGQPLGRARLHARYGDQVLDAELEQSHGAESIEATARIPLVVDPSVPTLAWRPHEEHRVSLRAQGVDDDTMRAAVELPRGLGFTAAARVEGHGSIDAPHLTGRLRASVRAGGSLDVPVAGVVELGPTEQHAVVRLGTRAHQGLEIEGRARGSLPQLLQGHAKLETTPVEVHARARGLPLGELAPVLPAAVVYDPQGLIGLEASITGTPADPTVRGTIDLDDAALTVVPLNQRFTHIELHAALDGSELTLRQLSARSGQGRVSAQARLHLDPGHVRGHAQVTASKLPIVRPGLPVMQLQARVDATLDATGPATEVELAIHDAVIDLLELGPLMDVEPIARDDGVIYVDPAGLRARREAEDEGPTPSVPAAVDLTVRLADPLRVRGSMADMDWQGQVKVTNPPKGPPSATGSFRLDGGRVTVLGNDFEIERAQVRFPAVGSLDPFIDLVATVQTSEAKVTMIVRGRVSRPSLTLRSDPSMSQSDILALLVTGHADASRTKESNVSAKAASLLVAVSNPELHRYVQSTIGLDRIGVGFGDDIDEPIVTVGKRLSKKVYVEAEYHHNAPAGENDAEVRIEYRFAPPRWRLETWFGNAAEGGVAVWWQRRFQSREQRRAEQERARAKSSDVPSPTP